MDIKELIANSHLAFINQENELALQLAQKALEVEPNNSNAYKCAANALMSLESYDEAIKNYRMALKYDPANGNRYFDLGFALATNEKLADALKYLAKADELGCTPENLIQLYNLLGIICFDIGRYDDALVNLGKAEQLAGVNLDIMQRKAIIYGIRNEIRNGLEVANQIKLVAPSEYLGYQLAFKLLIQAKRLNTAAEELQKAAKYATPNADMYFDFMTMELEQYKEDKDPEHFYTALGIIDRTLTDIKPTLLSTVECYINAAELYMQLEDADKTLDCLSAAQAPVAAYNNRFFVLQMPEQMPPELSADAIEEMIAQGHEQLDAAYDNYSMEQIFDEFQPNEDGDREIFTYYDDVPQEETVQFILEEDESFRIPTEQADQINRLYIGAYTLKQDYENVITYARILQAGEGVQNTHIGKYTEANAYLMMGSEEAPAKYAEAIKFFRNAMIKDPSDMMAVTFRIQCCIDIGEYDEAERICKLLAEEARRPLLEKIEKAKNGGE